MLKVYIAGAIGADNPTEMFASIRRGLELSHQVRKLGHAPYPTFTNFVWSVTDDVPNEDYYSMDLAWLEAADVMVVVPERRHESFGVSKLEIPFCEERGIPVCYGVEDFKDWLHEYEKDHS